MRFSEKSLARRACLAAAMGAVMLLAACSETPSPALVNPFFVAVGGSSTSDAYAVGGETVMHYDGRSWLPVRTGSGGFLNGIWAPSKSSIYCPWSSGDGGLTGQIFHFDGRAWKSIASAPAALQSVWGSSESDIFVVGRQGTILHFDGTTWSSYSTGRYEWLEGIWGSSPRDVFVAGPSDSVLHYDGAIWTRQYTGTLALALWGSSSGDVFAVGGYTITHY